MLAPIWRERNEKKWDANWEEIKRTFRAASAAACFALGNLAGGGVEIGIVRQWLEQVKEHSPMPSVPPRQGEEMAYTNARRLFDFGPPDALYLGIRAGRRAIAAKSDDATTYQYLARNYLALIGETREGVQARAVGYPFLLRRVQIAAALHRALECDPNLEEAHALSEQFYEASFIDLAKDHADKLQMLLLQSADAKIRRQAEAMDKEIAKLGKIVAERQTSYELLRRRPAGAGKGERGAGTRSRTKGAGHAGAG